MWWIVHDGGMLMLLPFLLRHHKVGEHGWVWDGEGVCACRCTGGGAPGSGQGKPPSPLLSLPGVLGTNASP